MLKGNVQEIVQNFLDFQESSYRKSALYCTFPEVGNFTFVPVVHCHSIQTLFARGFACQCHNSKLGKGSYNWGVMIYTMLVGKDR